jgi:bacteriophage N4 adsorption protein B
LLKCQCISACQSFRAWHLVNRWSNSVTIANARGQRTVFDGLTIGALNAAWELALFAGSLFLLLGVDDLAVDALWLSGIGRVAPQRLPPTPQFGEAGKVAPWSLALFIPAWREETVIRPMLARITALWDDQQLRIYVGTYANDDATRAAVIAAAALDPRIHMVTNDCAGPTTKGDNLNSLWRALAVDRAAGAFMPEAIILHDAEDVVDAHELCAYRAALASADVVQLPVIPLLHPRGRFVSGHYCDEFAEMHYRALPLRVALGAAMPLAGVGCAMRLGKLDAIADRSGAGPFAADSLVEDYEVGVRLWAAGADARFAHYTSTDGQLVATRAYFPHHYEAAVQQKARWVQGIALGGWDRLGWLVRTQSPSRARLAALWMLWRDRRALLAAVGIFAAYTAGALIIVAELVAPGARDLLWADRGWADILFTANALLLTWRLATRMWCTWQCYGWAQAPFAAVRSVVSNFILVHSCMRAVFRYRPARPGDAPCWDKTMHEFPAQFAPGASVVGQQL